MMKRTVQAVPDRSPRFSVRAGRRRLPLIASLAAVLLVTACGNPLIRDIMDKHKPEQEAEDQAAAQPGGGPAAPPPVPPVPPLMLTSVAAVADYLAGAAGDPVYLPVRLNLAGTGWKDLLGAIASADKNVTLDLSACTMAGTEFDPGFDSPDWDTPEKNAGKDRIVSLVLPDAATSIKGVLPFMMNAPFRYFGRLKEAAGVNVVTVGPYAFTECFDLKTVDFPAAAGIGESAFSDCTALETVKLPAAAHIGDQAFFNCTALKTADLSSAADIGESAFYGCTALKTVKLPAAAHIGNKAFLFCTALKTVDLSSAANIGNQAFEYTGSESLTVTLGNTVPNLGENMFSSISNKTVTVQVPGGASGYGPVPAQYDNDDNATPSWGNGFRGGGWNGAMAGGAVNNGVTLRVEYR